MKTVRFGKQNMVSLALLLAACGSGGSKDSSSSPAPSGVAAVGSEITVTGSIKSVSGSQSEMKDWVIAMIDYDNSISSVGVVNAAGNFSLPNVLSSERYTLALLDPQYKLAAVLSSLAEDNKSDKQVFRLSGTQLPTLVNNGPVINFTSASGIAWEAVRAKDSDGDGIPDGREASLANAVAPIDTDGDGVANATDPDIDGDGLINVLDLDDDGDKLADAFDTDSNGDLIADTSENNTDLYYPALIDFGSIQVVQDTQADSSFVTSLLITSKIQKQTPSALKMRGPTSLLEGSQSVRVNPDTGDAITTTWDNALLDDGLNGDGAAGDGTYVRRVQLATGKIPRAQQVMFFQFYDEVVGTGTRIRELPFMFPDVVTGAISGTYTAATRTVTLVGAPFNSVKTFKWTVDVYSSSGAKVFVSEPIDGAATTYAIPASVMEAGSTYTAKITATTPERLPSYPAWIVRSASFNL
ncbi:MAG: hypothetical protein H7249_19565 [Chitinophagaceae bacterium]|nr:hypothetical protein [Oligoflexus sp.]